MQELEVDHGQGPLRETSEIVRDSLGRGCGRASTSLPDGLAGRLASPAARLLAQDGVPGMCGRGSMSFGEIASTTQKPEWHTAATTDLARISGDVHLMHGCHAYSDASLVPFAPTPLALLVGQEEGPRCLAFLHASHQLQRRRRLVGHSSPCAGAGEHCTTPSWTWHQVVLVSLGRYDVSLAFAGMVEKHVAKLQGLLGARSAGGGSWPSCTAPLSGSAARLLRARLRVGHHLVAGHRIAYRRSDGPW